MSVVKKSIESVKRGRPLGIVIVAVFTILAGLAEVVTGFTHYFGRIVLVLTGLYPINSLKNTFSIIAGTVIVAVVAIYIGFNWKSFRL